MHVIENEDILNKIDNNIHRNRSIEEETLSVKMTLVHQCFHQLDQWRQQDLKEIFQ